MYPTLYLHLSYPQFENKDFSLKEIRLKNIWDAFTGYTPIPWNQNLESVMDAENFGSLNTVTKGIIAELFAVVLSGIIQTRKDVEHSAFKNLNSVSL